MSYRENQLKKQEEENSSQEKRNPNSLEAYEQIFKTETVWCWFSQLMTVYKSEIQHGPSLCRSRKLAIMLLKMLM